MERSIKAAAICRFFAARKDRAIVTKAKSNDRATLHAHFAQSFYSLCGSLRGLLSAGAGNTSASSMAWQAAATQSTWCTRLLGMQPCMVVRHTSPEPVVVA